MNLSNQIVTRFIEENIDILKPMVLGKNIRHTYKNRIGVILDINKHQFFIRWEDTPDEVQAFYLHVLTDFYFI